MNEGCILFRKEWLFSDAESGHAEQCVACRSWMAAARVRIDALGSLCAFPAPDELDQQVAAELAGTSTRRMTSVLTSLVRHTAPRQLDELVRRRVLERGDPARGAERARALSTLDIHAAPEVLERLLREELGNPAGARASRMAGNFERLEAPSSLGDRLAVGLRRRATLRTLLPPLVSLAAAAMVVWLTLRTADETRPEKARRTYSFEVVRASSLEGIDPMARSLGLLLGGDTSAGDGPR